MFVFSQGHPASRAFMRESLRCSEIASVGEREAGHAPVSELRCVQMLGELMTYVLYRTWEWGLTFINMV